MSVNPPITTIMPGGITNAQIDNFWAKTNGRFPDPTRYVEIFEDFMRFDAAEFDLSVNTGSPSVAIFNGKGGILQLTNSAADNDNQFIQAEADTAAFEPGRETWLEIRASLSDANLSDMVAGLQPQNADPLNENNGVWFEKLSGDNTVFLVTALGGVRNTLELGEMEDDTFFTLGYYYDGVNPGIQGYFNNNFVGIVPGSDQPTAVDLTPIFGVQNGEAVAKALRLDYILLCMER